MNSTIPTLGPSQIEELSAMIEGIEEENKKPLEYLLRNLVDIESISILSLYKLTCEEWEKKQKIIDNLCHFSLTMMNTLNLLWDQKQEQEDRLKHSDALICQLQEQIFTIREQNEKCKSQMQQAQVHLESISGEKDKLQELYRTQSCCNFAESSLSDPQKSIRDTPIECLECKMHQSLLEEEKDERSKQRIMLNQKENQIIYLRQQRNELEKKCEELVEENQLAKIEIQLAEIAVKDALSFREASISDRSSTMSRSYILNRSDEIYSTKSHAQFMNGQLQCFSNIDESFNLELKNFQSDFKQSISQATVSDVSPYTPNPELTLSAVQNGSAFKKKGTPTDQQRLLTEGNQPFTGSKSIQTKICKNKKTVSLQCNLLKNVPKLRLFPKRVIQQKTIDSSRVIIGIKEKEIVKKAALQGSKSQVIIKTNFSSTQSSKSSFGRLFSFFSNKIIASRIKTK